MTPHHVREPRYHSVGATDNLALFGWVLQFLVGLRQTARESDATGHGIEFCDDHAMLDRNYIRADNSRQQVAESIHSAVRNQRLRLSLVQILGHPRRLSALDAIVVQPIERSVKS